MLTLDQWVDKFVLELNKARIQDRRTDMSCSLNSADFDANLNLTNYEDPSYNYASKEVDLGESWEVLENEKKDELAPIFLFLTSSLNVELVYIILKSITQFTKKHKKGGQRQVSAPIRDFSRGIHFISEVEDPDAIIQMDKMKIHNPEIWKDAKVEDFRETRSISTI